MDRQRIVGLQAVLLLVILCPVVKTFTKTISISRTEYEDELSRSWPIDEKSFLNFTFYANKMQIEESENCKADKLEIFDALNKFPMVKPICKNLDDNDTFPPFFILAYGLEITFKTDKDYTFGGFEFNITGTKPDNAAVCKLMHHKGEQLITSVLLGNHEGYPDTLDCEWAIKTKNGSHFKLQFEQFDIEYSGPECRYDRVNIFELQKNSSWKKTHGPFCGRRLPVNLTTGSDQVRIAFTTDKGENSKGFRIRYTEESLVSADEDEAPLTFATPSVNYLSLTPQEKTSNRKLRIIWRTQPGFVIALRFEELLSEAFLYDGPGRAFGRLPFNETNVTSNGFFVFAEFAESTVWGSSVTYRAVNGFSYETMSIVYSGSGRFISSARRRNRHVQYLTIMVDDGYFLRLFLRKNTILDKNPNTGDLGDCGRTGIALYDDEVKFENMVGPFCGIGINYVEEKLRTLVGISNKAYVVLYDYANVFNESWQASWLTPIPANCPGFNINKMAFEEERTISSKFLNMTAAVENDTNTLYISANANFQCSIVHMFNHTYSEKALDVVVTGPMKYRRCQLWNVTMENLPTSKYLTSQTCDEQIEVGEGNQSKIREIPENRNWTLGETWIELGDVGSSMCWNIPNCKSEKHFLKNQSCGVVTEQSILPDCPVHVVRPLYRGFWAVTISRLESEDKKEDASVKLTEIGSRARMTMEVRYHQIGEGRTFRFHSRPEVDLKIDFINVGSLLLRFDYKRSDLQKIPESPSDNNETTTSMNGVVKQNVTFSGSRYIFVQYKKEMSWKEVSDMCEQDGGWLVSINTISELEFIKKQLAEVVMADLADYHKAIVPIGLHDLGEPGEYRWKDGSPLTTTDWYYTFAGFDHVVGQTTLESNGETAPSVLDIDRTQPVPNTGQRCVAMVPTNLYFSTNWRKMECEKSTYTDNVYKICEFQEQDIHPPTVEEIVANAPNKICNRGWTLVENRCMAVLTADVPPIEYVRPDDAADLCVEREGRIAVVGEDFLVPLKRFLYSVGMKDDSSGFWIAINSSAYACISLEMLESERMPTMINNCFLTTGEPSHVICESEYGNFIDRCAGYQFQCNDRTCLTPDLQCDKKDDCSEGEDEEGCSYTEEDTFTCRDSEKISLSRFCDLEVHCFDKSDERNCTREVCKSDEYKCRSGQCVPIKGRCDKRVDCFDDTDERNCDWGLDCKDFQCLLVGCIPNNQVNDLYPDCQDGTEGDERKNETEHKSWTHFLRGEKKRVVRRMNDCPGMVDYQRCHTDHIRCYPRSKACIFDKDEFNKTKYCRDGSHLRYCEHVKCPGMFKCPKSYCIPRYRVCDGVQDCAQGADENNCSSKANPCRYELRCKKSHQCVAQEHVCDGQVHCNESRSDEEFCNLLNTTCPDGCTCRGYILLCPGQGWTEIPLISYNRSIRSIDFTRNRINITDKTFIVYVRLFRLFLRSNQLKEIIPGSFETLPHLLTLDLRNNQIKVLKPHAFRGLQRLEILQLQGNPLTTIYPKTFSDLISLGDLNLTRMRLTSLPNESFSGMLSLLNLNLSRNNMDYIAPKAFAGLPQKLEKLFLKGNPLQSTEGEPFRNVSVKIMKTDSYRFCCYIRALGKVDECERDKDVFSSCTEFLDNDLLELSVWLYVVFIFGGNLGMIAWSAVFRFPDPASVLIVNMSQSQMLMGIGLCILGFVDVRYGDNFLPYDIEWRHSGLCQLVGILVAIGYEKAMFDLVFLAVYRATRLSEKGWQMTHKHAIILNIVGWIFCFAATIIPLAAAGHFHEFYSKNTICLPFDFDLPKGKGWWHATLILVILTTASLATIIAMACFLASKGNLYEDDSDETFDPNIDTVKRLADMFTTNVFLMSLVLLANFLSVAGIPFSREIGSLVEVLFLPMSAAINPLLYILNAIQSRRIEGYISKKGKKQ